MYQGHLNDGSSIQKHSAGGLYPYVLFAKQQPTGLAWGFMAPTGFERLVGDYEKAADAAQAHKAEA